MDCFELDVFAVDCVASSFLLVIRQAVLGIDDLRKARGLHSGRSKTVVDRLFSAADSIQGTSLCRSKKTLSNYLRLLFPEIVFWYRHVLNVWYVLRWPCRRDVKKWTRCSSQFVSRFGLAVRRYRLVSGRTSVRYRFGSPFSSKRLWFVDAVLWLCPSLPTETLKWLSSLPILMQQSFWWWQCSDRYVISLSPHLHTPSPFSPSLISLTVSVDVKHHVYLLLLSCHCEKTSNRFHLKIILMAMLYYLS